ncbi:hypothetical protein LWC33_25780, partial [Pseudonocardia sp. RS11V-5]|uniref:hypothetical protein n=1 Tax=Pseudonocardia terrae TaxID=2905831 RepID=UPI001E511B59
PTEQPTLPNRPFDTSHLGRVQEVTIDGLLDPDRGWQGATPASYRAYSAAGGNATRRDLGAKTAIREFLNTA